MPECTPKQKTRVEGAPGSIARGATLAFALFLGAGGCHGNEGPPPPKPLSIEALCADCRIELHPVATLLPDPPRVDFVFKTKLALDNRNRYLLAPLASPTEVAVYSPEGELLETFGREGPGPGEFTSIQDILVTPDDSVFITDLNGDIDVFDADFAFARSFRAPGLPTALAATSHHLFFSLLTPNTDPAWPATPILILDRPTGRWTEYHGQHTTVPRSYRHLSVGDTSRVWSVTRDYLIESFDATGRTLATLSGDLESLELDGEPVLSVHDVMATTDRLWVLLSGRRTDWRPSPELLSRPQSSRPIMLPVGDAIQRHDFVLDVIDPLKGTFIRRKPLPDHFVGGFVNDTLLYTYASGLTHSVLIRVWRVHLVHLRKGE